MVERKLVGYVLVLTGMALTSSIFAAGLTISTVPLYVTQPLAPNVIISPVYNTEFNEVSLRKAPWLYINESCNANDPEQPCRSDTYIDTLWQAGAPFYQHNIGSYGSRVTPWPGVDKITVGGTSFVSSDVALYPNDFSSWGGVRQLKPLDYPPGVDNQMPTEEEYPDPTVLRDVTKLNPLVEGKSRYSRSDLNFLYFSKRSADSGGYLPWPSLGSWSFDAYGNSDAASAPFYHPIVRQYPSGAELKASMVDEYKHWARRCDPKKTASCSLGNQAVKKMDNAIIGNYWTYQGGNVWNYSNYTKTNWSDMGEADRIKFAHWFTYWRSADLSARGMVARLVDSLSSKNKDLLGKMRLGIFHVDASGNEVVKVEVKDTELSLIQSLADIVYRQDNVFTKVSPNSNFDETNRAYTTSVWRPNSTVKYFESEEPYRDDPSSVDSPVRSCRRNYEIVLTPDYSGLRRDNSALTIPYFHDAGSHNSDLDLQAPYADGYSNTLGDVGAYGWNRDLMPGLDDSLLAGKIDDQTAQHLVRYVIGPSDLGTVFNRPMVSYDDALQFLNNNPANEWANPALTEKIGPDVIDELWHMALNSRGYFYGGENVGDALDKLLQSLNDILVNNVSGSSIATSTTSLRNGGLIYQATVESDWKGHLRAYTVSKIEHASNQATLEVDYSGSIWDLAEQLSAQAWGERHIATYSGATGVPFRWDNLSVATKTALKTNIPAGITEPDVYGGKLLEYLRGSGVCEDGSGTSCSSGVGYSFRRRNLERNNTTRYSANNPGGRNLLGDIANSNPWYVSPPVAGPSDVDFPGYNAFRLAKKERPNVLYVGANDGMLHAVNASNGTEMFAYIPSFVHADLYELGKTSYGHNYYVDGSPFSANVNVDGWKTVLAGGANRGGKGYYLLDVTNPATNTEGNAADWVKWEFTHPDLYYSFNLPVADGHGQARQIARMNNGKAALIVGNGYPDKVADKQACLFVVYLTGPSGDNSTWSENTDYVKLCAGNTNYAATGGLDTNGLSTPTPFDSNGDGTVDMIYAGDLNGNMWRFDVTDPAPANWVVAYSGDPLFVAKNAANQRQPIISPPEVAHFKSGAATGQLVLFGTGKYIEADDRSNIDVQSFYGVWDRGLSGITRSNLVQQQLDAPVAVGEVVVRKQSQKSIPSYCSAGADPSECSTGLLHLGWYWDMPESGERLTGKVSLINSVVLFNTFYPTTETYSEGGVVKTRLDPCKYGGDGWLMGLNAVNGHMEDRFSVFDSNQDGVVNSSDVMAAGVQVGLTMGGTSFAQGIGDTMIGLYSPSNKEQSNKNNKAIINTGGPVTGRVSWFELLD